jgi:hypothetical protein
MNALDEVKLPSVELLDSSWMREISHVSHRYCLLFFHCLLPLRGKRDVNVMETYPPSFDTASWLVLVK